MMKDMNKKKLNKQANKQTTKRKEKDVNDKKLLLEHRINCEQEESVGEKTDLHEKS